MINLTIFEIATICFLVILTIVGCMLIYTLHCMNKTLAKIIPHMEIDVASMYPVWFKHNFQHPTYEELKIKEAKSYIDTVKNNDVNPNFLYK